MFARMLLVWLFVLNLGVIAWWVLHRPAVAESGAVPDATIPRIELLEESVGVPAPGSEVGHDAPADVQQSDIPAPLPEVAEAATPAQTARVCASFGPFAEEPQSAVASLRNAGAKVKLRQEASSGRGFDVQLPPLTSAEEARAMAARLREAGFRDLVVINQGPRQNGIALGRFGSEDNARRHQAALQAKGFAAQIIASGGNIRFWLDVEAHASFDSAAQRRAINAPKVQNLRC